MNAPHLRPSVCLALLLVATGFSFAQSPAISPSAASNRGGQKPDTAAGTAGKVSIPGTNKVGSPTKAPATKPAPWKVSPTELHVVREKTETLTKALAELRARKIPDETLVDVEIFERAGKMMLRFGDEEVFTQKFLTDAATVFSLGHKRVSNLLAGETPWSQARGRIVRGYRSRLDNTVQPYGLAIPPSYDGKTPMRLDVILHGRGGTLSEVNFIVSKEVPNGTLFTNAIRLEVYGRWNNAYRYAGEVDVFEAIESVKKRYAIDTNRIVLRGFSMGGGGAWHLGLHHPGTWAALEAGAGFTETIRFTRTSNFNPTELRLLPILDADPAALNCFNLPVVGYGGEDDKQLQASINIRDALSNEGFRFTPDGLDWRTDELPLVFLVGPKTGHKWHPESQAKSDQFLDLALSKTPSRPGRVRYVTWTTRYDRCDWVKVEGMERHLDRAEIDARLSAGGTRVEITLSNITRFRIDVPGLKTARIAGSEVAIPSPLPRGLTAPAFEKSPRGWALANEDLVPGQGPLRKTHGLSGPIDDAFMEPFLCVTPTGTPWNAVANSQAMALYKRFDFLYGKWLRGDLPVKRDVDVTEEDIRTRNLVLFGDPGANRLTARVLGKLPLTWTKDAVTIGTDTAPAVDHLPCLIQPNPLNPTRYVVLNTGHPITEKDWRGNNALQFGRWGDWALVKADALGGAMTNETVVTTGFFGEDWKPVKP